MANFADKQQKQQHTSRRRAWQADGCADSRPATPEQIVTLQRVVGNRAVVQMIRRQVANPPAEPSIQRYITTRTLAKTFTPRDGVTYLKAIIGSDQGWARGSKPAAGKPSRIKSVGAPLKGRYVGGHMLCQEAGGMGDANNMIVQSHTSNTNMNLHDNIIKRLAATANRLENLGTPSEKQFEYGVYETINVAGPAPDGTHNFPGERHLPASLSVTLTPIKQDRQTGVETPWTTHRENIVNPYPVVNVPPYPARPHAGVRRATPAAKQRRAKAKLRGLAGRFAHTLSVKKLKLVRGIGDVAANAIFNHLRVHKLTLAQLLQSNLSGLGFRRDHVAALMHEGFT